MSSSVRCASAASTSSCMPLTSSATRSASARAACSRSSASRSSCWRRRSVTSRMKPGHQDLAAHVDPRDGRLRREASAVAAHELDLVVLGRRAAAVDERADGARRGGRGTPPGRSACASAGRSPRPAVQPNIRSAAMFQVRITPSASSVTNASGALSSTRRVRASLSRSSRARSSDSGCPARRPVEHARDQQACDQRRADREQPADQRAGRVLYREHDRVAQRR